VFVARTTISPPLLEVSKTYRLNKSETISTSVSAAAIFCSEESWGRPPNRKDMVTSVFRVDNYLWVAVSIGNNNSSISGEYSERQYLYRLVDGVVQVGLIEKCILSRERSQQQLPIGKTKKLGPPVIAVLPLAAQFFSSSFFSTQTTNLQRTQLTQLYQPNAINWSRKGLSEASG
jgi:hypothetical protein